jgi:hypothetical protein
VGAATDNDSIGARLQGAPSAPVAAASPDLARVLPVLKHPAVAAPASVKRMVQVDDIARLGVNPALTRSIPAPAGAQAKTWYLVPGEGVLCFAAGDADVAETCATTDQVAKNGLLTMQLPGSIPAGAHLPDGTPIHLDPKLAGEPQRFQGVAPAGIDTVTAVDADGQPEASTKVDANGAYLVESHNASKLVLSGPSTSTTIAFG